MELKIIFGKILKELRLEKGLTQEALAEHSNLGVTFISKLENGKRQPTITTLFQLAEALNIKPSEIIERLEKEI
tara:strand:- start:15 stop:236 length:222 start_codon:yes stop_codon:yes gene_type:complete